MYLACSFFVKLAAFCEKKEQAIYEMDVGERREWERIGGIGRDRKKCK